MHGTHETAAVARRMRVGLAQALEAVLSAATTARPREGFASAGEAAAAAKQDTQAARGVVSEAGRDVAACADKVAMLFGFTGAAVDDSAGASCLEALEQAAGVLVAVSAAATQGAGPTLLGALRAGVGAVLAAACDLADAAVARQSGEGGGADVQASMAPMAGRVGDRAEALARGAFDNRAACGRAVAKLGKSVKAAGEELAEMIREAEEKAGEEERNSALGDNDEDDDFALDTLSATELVVARAAQPALAAAFDVLKAAVRACARSPRDDSATLEALLAKSREASRLAEDAVAVLYAPHDDDEVRGAADELDASAEPLCAAIEAAATSGDGDGDESGAADVVAAAGEAAAVMRGALEVVRTACQRDEGA